MVSDTFTFSKTLGTVVAVPEPPNQSQFTFVAGTDTTEEDIQVGLYVVSKDEGRLTIAVVEQIEKSNRYFTNAESVWNYEQGGVGVNSLFPVDQWEFLVARCSVIGYADHKGLHRATRPVSPGSKVFRSPTELLARVLGLNMNDGLHIGEIPHHELNARLDMNRLMQKHLAILSISGGGKSYTTKVLVEELLRRSPAKGRPAIVLFDVHGEYTGLANLPSHPEFRNAVVHLFDASAVSIFTPNLSAGDFGDYSPNMTGPQIRELSRIIHNRRRNKKRTAYDISRIIQDIDLEEDMNPYVKEALVSWLLQLHRMGIFGTEERPDIESLLVPGSAIIFDLSRMLNLTAKQIVIAYFLKRIFQLRRDNLVPPTVCILEEAHQFCPEGTGVRSPAKNIIETISREGRKFMVSLVLVSQRPVNLSTTALSQCNSQFILRILNPYDLDYVGKTSEGITRSTLDQITSLGVGECLVTGSAVNYPTFIKVRERIVKDHADSITFASVAKDFERARKKSIHPNTT